MAEREVECVNKVFKTQTGKSTFDELGHSEMPLKLAPQLHLSVRPCSKIALKPHSLMSPGSEGRVGPVRTPAADGRAHQRHGGHGGP